MGAEHYRPGKGVTALQVGSSSTSLPCQNWLTLPPLTTGARAAVCMSYSDWGESAMILRTELLCEQYQTGASLLFSRD